MSLPTYAMGTSSFPDMYEQRLVGPLFTPFAAMTLDRVPLTGARSLLDVACGTGIVARLAKERLGETAQVVGVDVSPPMLEVAARIASDIDWRAGRAEALPIASGEMFDVVICQQGLQFFADKTTACRELRRALAPNGTLAVAVWRSNADMPELAALRAVAERHLGPIDDQRYGFGDADVLAALLEVNGIRDVSVDVLDHVVRFDVGSQFVVLNAMAFVGMSGRAASMTEEDRAAVLERIVADSLGIIPPSSVEGLFEFKMSTNLAIGRA